MIKIRPSIASANQIEIKKECERIKGSKYLHIDIEDGNFVPNITFGLKTIKGIIGMGLFNYDIHLLTNNPQDYIDQLIDLCPEAVSFHIEACEYPLVILNKLRSKGIKSGLALNFKTDINQLMPFIGSLDYVLFMCAEPDYLGDRFNSLILDKIAAARKILPESIEIWADGDINESNYRTLIDAGATNLIMGRSVWSKDDPLSFIDYLSNGSNK